MASVDVPVALLGYGTVGSAVHRLLTDSADDIERATGHRLRGVRALRPRPRKESSLGTAAVRPAPGKGRCFVPAEGVLTDDVAAIRDDPQIALVAEVMGGIDPTGSYVLD